MQKDKTTSLHHCNINIMFTAKKEMEGRKQAIKLDSDEQPSDWRDPGTTKLCLQH